VVFYLGIVDVRIHPHEVGHLREPFQGLDMRGLNIEESRFLHEFNERKEKSEATGDKKRVATYLEDTVTEHLFGAAGLKDFLITADIMDPVTKKSADEHHVIRQGTRAEAHFLMNPFVVYAHLIRSEALRQPDIY
jgi:hypothetical protein